MSRAKKPLANIYNPLNLDKKTLLDNFVIRKNEFKSIFRDLKNSKLNETSQNFLIQGQRGSGKTTLLAKLRYEIEDSEKLSHLLAIQFTEEQYNIFSLNRLWESVADILEEVKGFEALSDQMDQYEDDDYYSLIAKYLKKNKKKLVLLIDNFGDILDKLNDKEHKKLRDILHETDLQIIATSTKTLETTYKHNKPFFESFKTIYLDAITKADVQILLERLGSQYENRKVVEVIKHQKGRIETIRRLTGGIPRTIILLYEIILDDSASVFEDLEGILDKITPLYKHRMDDLSTQQQAIVDAIALNWDGMLTSEISKKTNLEPKTISAQLKILEKNGLITSKFINKKNKIYMLSERFFNIWYLMRYGRKKKKQQVLWLVSFLKEWCAEDELAQKARNHIMLAKSGALSQRGGYYMAEALSQSIRDTEIQYEVLTSTKEYLSRSAPELAKNLSDTDDMGLKIAVKAHSDGNFSKAEKYYLMAIEEYFKNKMAFLIQAKFRDDEERNVLLGIFEKHHTKRNYIRLLGLSIMMIHVERYKESVEYFNDFLKVIKNIDDFQQHITNYVMLLISRKQYHLALKLFHEEKYHLQEKIKPVYYALMSLMKKEYPTEYKRMGQEISDTVNEVLDTIKALEK